MTVLQQEFSNSLKQVQRPEETNTKYNNTQDY